MRPAERAPHGAAPRGDRGVVPGAGYAGGGAPGFGLLCGAWQPDERDLSPRPEAEPFPTAPAGCRAVPSRAGCARGPGPRLSLNVPPRVGCAGASSSRPDERGLPPRTGSAEPFPTAPAGCRAVPSRAGCARGRVPGPRSPRGTSQADERSLPLRNLAAPAGCRAVPSRAGCARGRVLPAAPQGQRFLPPRTGSAEPPHPGCPGASPPRPEAEPFPVAPAAGPPASRRPHRPFPPDESKDPC
ncbi:hypothetical protein GCM10009544_62600 [Streptomyces stramineus]|uniref:Uncharacterized protein n=1 Tax=Streptomyces stramineus TaxID=173861 RepID=A0ABP3L5K0_9ACTN